MEKRVRLFDKFIFVFVKKHGLSMLLSFNTNKRDFMGFIVPFIGPAVTAAAGYLGYQTAQTALKATTQVGVEILKEHGKEIARSVTSYVSSQILQWQCDSATEYVETKCVNRTYTFTAFDCHAMVVKQFTTCWGAMATSAMSAIQSSHSAIPIFKK